MNERERLMYLVKNAIAAYKSTYDCVISEEEFIVDFLIADSVIVPPCKIGDVVYILAGFNGRKYEKDICEGFYIGGDGVVQVRVRNMKGNHGTYGVMGETVFLTREEAEAALKGGIKNEVR